MKDKKVKKIIKRASITVVIMAGVVAGIIYNNSGNSFIPSLSDRKYNFNYVHLDGESDELEKKDGGEDNDNTLLEKDKNAAQNKKQGNNAAYIMNNNQIDNTRNDEPGDRTYDTMRENNHNIINEDNLPSGTDDNFNVINVNVNNTVSNVNNMTNADSADIKKDNIYNIVEPKDNPDIVLPGNSVSDKNIIHGGTNNSESSSTGPELPEEGDIPTNKIPDDSDGSGMNDSDEVDRSETAVDPEIEKPRPGVSGSFESKPYDEGNVTESPDKVVNVVIQPGISYDAPSLYKGQSIDAYTIFCVLDTYVVKIENDNPVLYLWGKESYNKYIQITSVSFDNGNSWNSQFPVTIPKDMKNDSIIINAKYRLSLNSEWVEEKISYYPKDSRLFVLSSQITSDNEIIADDKILNYDQYPEPGSKVNLYKYQNNFLKDGQLEYLFPGWVENKKLVPWMYKTGVGRHILQPSAMISLDKKYTVFKKYKWMTKDGYVDDDGSEYCSLQTLVKVNYNNTIANNQFFNGKKLSYNVSCINFSLYRGVENDNKQKIKGRLDVPKYIQSVELQEPIDVDYMSIPETVIYINNDGQNLNVAKGYEVADSNMHYSSQNGLLMSKDKTQILAIPYDYNSITIDKDIKKVVINANNNLSEIVIKSDDIKSLPELDYTHINNCRIIVDDALLDEYLKLNYNKLSGSDNVVVSSKKTDITYKVINGMIIDNKGCLCNIAATSGSSIRLIEDVKSISSGVFDKCVNIKRIIITGNDNVILNKDCLKNSSIEDILCHNETQKNDIIRQLSDAGKKEVNVYVASESSDGYIYCSVIRDDSVVNVLIKAPQNITEFDGTIENHTISINEIDNNCFAENTNLEWAILPECVTHIGAEAFIDCTSLQGVLIKSKDKISIGNNAFDGCNSLRFVASNAMNAVMEDGYDPVITDDYAYGMETNRYFFTLKDATGYGCNADSINSIDYIEEFILVKAGGSYLLYGADYYGEETVLLRSGKDISGEISIVQSVMYIYKYAFADAGCIDGFTVNWKDMEWISGIYKGAFYNSGLEGSVKIVAEQGILIYEDAFSKCCNVTDISIDGSIYYLGDMVFNECTSLKSVKLGYIDDWSGALHSGLFTGCDKLRTIELSNDNPMQLVTYEGNGFQFNYTWSRSEESEKLRIIVPEGTQEKYILTWRYCMSGYTGIYSGSPYIDMWNSIQSELIDWENFVLPKDSQVDAELSKRLLESENYLRTILGMKNTDSPTGLYPFRLSEGYLTLAGVPSDIKQLDFTTDDCGLPTGWFMDYIGKDAFAGASGLENVVIADNLVGIYSGAFNGASKNTDKLTIEFRSDKPVQLICDMDSAKFSFGIDTKKLIIIVPKGTKDTYVTEWSAYMDKEKLDSMIIEKLDSIIIEKEQQSE